MQTATATPAKPTMKRTRKTTGNRAGRTTDTGAAIDAGNLARLQEDEELAARAGLSLPPPVYTLGTEVNEIGRKNFLTKRAAWDARPGFGAVCTEAIERIRAERRANVEVQLSDLFMRSNGALVHAPIGTSTDAPAAEWQLTKTGLMGLMGPISGANGGARYLLDAPADLRAMNLNYWISGLIRDEKAREKVWSLRTRECMDPRQAGQREVFAATSTSYPVLDADTLAEVAAAAVPAGAKGELVYDGTRFRLGASWFSDIQPAQVCAGEVFLGLAGRASPASSSSTRALRNGRRCSSVSAATSWRRRSASSSGSPAAARFVGVARSGFRPLLLAFLPRPWPLLPVVDERDIFFVAMTWPPPGLGSGARPVCPAPPGPALHVGLLLRHDRDLDGARVAVVGSAVVFGTC